MTKKMTSEQPHCTLITVRGYELDSYGHVNNAVYLQYLEQARWVLMKEMELLKQINDEELFLVVTETHIRYLREANIFDELIIETTLKVEKPYLVFRQKIMNASTRIPLSRAIVKTIFVNEQRMPMDIPAFILQKLSKAQ
jgi:YbgC/YbaW family acyl-CoA thioester hydrolase